MRKPPVTPLRILHRSLVGFATLLLLFMGLYFARELGKFEAWSDSGRLDARFETRLDSLAVFLDFVAADRLEGPLPLPGDTLLAVEDTLVALPEIVAFFERPDPPGRRLRLLVGSAAGRREVVAATRLPALGERVSSASLILLRLLTALAFAAVGLRAVLKRPDSPGVRALLLYSLSMAAFMTVNVQMMNASYASFDFPGRREITLGLNVFGMAFSAFWLHLTLLFPRAPRFLRGRHWPVWLVCYLPFAGLQLAARTLPGNPMGYAAAVFLTMGLQVLGGLVRLWWCVTHASSPLERRQSRIVLMGSGLGQLLLVALIVVLNLLRDWTESWSSGLTMWTINLVFLALLCGPLSTAWAFGRYRLLEVEVRLRRGTRVALYSGALMGALALAAWGAALALVQLLGVEGRDSTVALAILLALAVLPVHFWLMKRLQGRVFPERERMRAMVGDFFERMIAMPDRASLWRQLEERLRRELGTVAVLPVLCGDGDVQCFHEGVDVPFRADGDLVALLAGLPAPLPLDELLAGGRIPLRPEQEDWLRERKVALLLPLRAGRRATGFLALGGRADGEDYGPEELQALGVLAGQVALAAENLRLLEENLEKRRLDEQLAMARQIQLRFLPADLPPTPGLDVVARSLFCLEVAGDYYDVITLPDGRTVLAVGDVSGKGAGAAMLMANLQASLRTALRVGGALEETVAGINQLICGNTGDEQFITFFVGVYDPRGGRFEYVNAGHNPPLVVRAGGGVDELSAGGLLLGVVPEAVYERAETVLAPGDLLLLYTDGVSEALDGREEEFGEGRMLDVLRAHPDRSPAELLELIEREVVRFQGREGFADDFTLLLSRVVAA